MTITTSARCTIHGSETIGSAGTALVSLAALMLIVAPFGMTGPVFAQSDPSNSQETIAPFGKDMTVETEKQPISADAVLSRVEESAKDAAKVKELSKLDVVKIVRLPDIVDATGEAKIAAAVEQRREDVGGLQTALEGNALTHAALDAQTVLSSQVVGVHIEGDRRTSITIYVRQ